MRKRIVTPEDKEIMLKFGEKLKKLLEDTKTPYSEIAKGIGVHPNTIGLWVRGESQPTLSHIYRISKYFKGLISIKEYLFFDLS